MTGFIIWAALCAAGATLFVVWPLLRPRPGAPPPERRLGIAIGLLLLAGAATLYPLWSHWRWGQLPTGDDRQGIALLVAATVRHPEDIQGWLDLGRSYLQIEQWPLARRSFQQADHLSHGGNAAALTGLAETMMFENGGEETAAAAALFDRALQLDPRSPQALFYVGVRLLRNGDLANARAHFVALRDLAPPAPVVDALDKQIAAIDIELARSRPDPATAIHLLVDLATPTAGQVPAGATLFVFVRAPEGGPPLAVKRLAPAFPQQVDLSSTDAVLASRSFTAGQTVRVIARISASGTPTASPGDFFGEISTTAGSKGQRRLVIDRRSP